MTLSRPFQRLMPLVVISSLICVSGCANTGNMSAGRLPYHNVATRQGTQDPFKAAANAQNPAAPTEVASAGATGPANNTPSNPLGQMSPPPVASAPPTAVTSEDLGQTPPWPRAVVTGTSSQPLPAMNSGAYAAAPPTEHQSAYYEQPAQGGGFPVAPAENIQQMSHYSAAIANDDPFAEVSGQPANSSPVQYSEPSAPPDWATPPPAPTATGSVPYEWGAPTAGTVSDEFLPPIRQ